MDPERNRPNSSDRNPNPSMSRILSTIKTPAFLIGLAVGAVLAVAFAAVANLVRPVAKVIPGSQA